MFSNVCNFAQSESVINHVASTPLFNDPIYDGAANPVIIWNRQEKSWWMLYTTRSSNLETWGISRYYKLLNSEVNSHSCIKQFLPN